MGHIDEIGLIVTHIDDDGYLWFGEVGGWDPQILVCQRVIIDTAKGPLAGVVGRKPIHLLRDEERKKVAEIRDLHIDIGARDGGAGRELVRVGDVAVIDVGAAGAAERAAGLARAGQPPRLYVALEAARQVAEAGGSAWELAAVAAVQEETTFGGSRTSAFALAPDAAIVIDVTHATDAPGIEVKPSGKHPLGSGPVIARGSTLHEGVFELLYETARAERHPVHDRSLRARHGHRRGRGARQPRGRAHGAGDRSPSATCTPRWRRSSCRTCRPPSACWPRRRSR